MGEFLVWGYIITPSQYTMRFYQISQLVQFRVWVILVSLQHDFSGTAAIQASCVRVVYINHAHYETLTGIQVARFNFFAQGFGQLLLLLSPYLSMHLLYTAVCYKSYSTYNFAPGQHRHGQYRRCQSNQIGRRATGSLF